MEKLKQFPAAQKRLVCILLALICMPSYNFHDV